jgi:5-methylcytosine-specific restriction endonuclease McrA
VLLLNATYEPLRIVCWQKAMVLWFQQKAEIVVSHDTYIRSVQSQVRAPAVLRLKQFVKPRPQKGVRLSRENIFLRDQHTCQYCHKKIVAKELTLDHVMPASRGGGKSWENLVAACHRCNHKKGNRTPDEANMPLRTQPVRLKWSPASDIQIKWDTVDVLWSPYLDFLSVVNF